MGRDFLFVGTSSHVPPRLPDQACRCTLQSVRIGSILWNNPLIECRRGRTFLWPRGPECIHHFSLNQTETRLYNDTVCQIIVPESQRPECASFSATETMRCCKIYVMLLMLSAIWLSVCGQVNSQPGCGDHHCKRVPLWTCKFPTNCREILFVPTARVLCACESCTPPLCLLLQMDVKCRNRLPRRGLWGTLPSFSELRQLEHLFVAENARFVAKPCAHPLVNAVWFVCPRIYCTCYAAFSLPTALSSWAALPTFPVQSAPTVAHTQESSRQ